MPCAAASRQRSRPWRTDEAPSSPEGTTCEWQSTKKAVSSTLSRVPTGTPVAGRGLLGLVEVQLQPRRDVAQFPQRARLELADPLAGDAETDADLLERLGMVPVEAEAQSENPAHARVESLERAGELLGAQSLGSRGVWAVGLRVLDQVAVEALAVADRSLEADRVLDEIEELLNTLGREPALLRNFRDEWIAVQFLGENAPCAQDLSCLLGDVDR